MVARAAKGLEIKAGSRVRLLGTDDLEAHVVVEVMGGGWLKVKRLSDNFEHKARSGSKNVKLIEDEWDKVDKEPTVEDEVADVKVRIKKVRARIESLSRELEDAVNV